MGESFNRRLSKPHSKRMNKLNRRSWAWVDREIDSLRARWNPDPQGWVYLIKAVVKNKLRAPINNKGYKLDRIIETFENLPSVEFGLGYFVTAYCFADSTAKLSEDGNYFVRGAKSSDNKLLGTSCRRIAFASNEHIEMIESCESDRRSRPGRQSPLFDKNPSK